MADINLTVTPFPIPIEWPDLVIELVPAPQLLAEEPLVIPLEFEAQTASPEPLVVPDPLLIELVFGPVTVTPGSPDDVPPVQPPPPPPGDEVNGDPAHRPTIDPAVAASGAVRVRGMRVRGR